MKRLFITLKPLLIHLHRTLEEDSLEHSAKDVEKQAGLASDAAVRVPKRAAPAQSDGSVFDALVREQVRE
jgi:hypothetical protein